MRCRADQEGPSHFECKQCGETSAVDLGQEWLDLHLALVSAQSGFEVLDFEVWMIGTCSVCVAQDETTHAEVEILTTHAEVER